MEKAPGIQLFKVWADISAVDRLGLIKKLTQLEKQLASIHFPAYGSLYFRHSILIDSERVLLDSSLDPSAMFCIGPSCGPAWTDGTSPADISSDLDAGPWSNILQLGIALSRRSVARTHLPVAGNFPSHLQGTKQDHVYLHNTAKSLLQRLTQRSHLWPWSKPTLWHTDLHMGNIFVSEDDHTQITSLIDWQSTSISPLFVQVRWPKFLKPPEDYPEGFVQPKLPSNFEELSPDEKEVALFKKDQAGNSKAYEVATYLNNHEVYVAGWQVDNALREFFKRIGDTWDDGIVPFSTCLIDMCKNWEHMGFQKSCPIQFNASEMAIHEGQAKDYKRWHDRQDIAQGYLDTDAEGWIAPSFDIVEKRRQNKVLLDLMAERAQSKAEAEEVRQTWPFPPGGSPFL
ncbi:MAG: hypothetical protein Q9172_001169 [Xanthocarpia lactea]